jgi:hypothetical protein
MIRGALQRFLGMFVLAAGVTVVVSILVGVLLGASPRRAVSLGFYVIGCFLLIAGFFVGNRGPVRASSEGGMFLLPFANRRLRWASPTENDETINLSAVFVSLGFTLLLVGVGVDSRVALV